MSLPGPLMAVTVHMPWAWLLAAGYKPLENRNWVPKIVPVGAWMAIHAGIAITAYVMLLAWYLLG